MNSNIDEDPKPKDDVKIFKNKVSNKDTIIIYFLIKGD